MENLINNKEFLRELSIDFPDNNPPNLNDYFTRNIFLLLDRLHEKKQIQLSRFEINNLTLVDFTEDDIIDRLLESKQNLRIFSIFNCNFITSKLVKVLDEFINLERLTLDYSPIKEFQLKGLHKLKKLSLSQCITLETIDIELEELEILNISYNPNCVSLKLITPSKLVYLFQKKLIN